MIYHQLDSIFSEDKLNEIIRNYDKCRKCNQEIIYCDCKCIFCGTYDDDCKCEISLQLVIP